jgi:hypothetical protein
VLQVIPQALLVQVAVPFGSVGQALPQVPQLVTLVVVSAQPAGQSVGVALGQPEAHTELTQAGVPPSGAHALLQLPQCWLLVARLKHVPPQSAYPLLQVWPQTPPVQVAVALATLGHLLVQLPQ